MRISRIRLSDWFHTKACEPGTACTIPRSGTRCCSLSRDVEPPRKRPDHLPECIGQRPISSPQLLPEHPEPGLLPSTGITRLQRYYEPLRLPPRPLLQEERCRSATPAPRGASRVATHSVSTCRLHYPGESSGRMAVSSHPDAAAFPVLAAGRHSRLRLSRPAQSSLTLRPADLLAPLKGAFVRAA
jgi:hypothetical protein